MSFAANVSLAIYSNVGQRMKRAFFEDADIDIRAFSKLCEQQTLRDDYPLAADLVENVVVYDGPALTQATSSSQRMAKQELAHCLNDGPGVFVVRGAYHDLTVIDRCTTVFRQIAANEVAAGIGQGDHFGNNERIWNTIQKVCVAAPDVFVDYYSNPILRLASEAWLGPNYQITSQMNNVKPGGIEQAAHRDYHLGFQTDDTIGCFPAHAQVMSQFLTLQGAVAHCDMPLENGPTFFLPYSQQYAAGYLAFRRPEFAEYFSQQRVQLPLAKGDMVFFNPALFHAGGRNSLDRDRVANLLQISSAFGRTMESIDRRAMIAAAYPILLERTLEGTITDRETENAVAAIANGYAFPTNLDSDPPIHGRSPQSQQDILSTAIQERWSLDRLTRTIDEYESRRQA